MLEDVLQTRSKVKGNRSSLIKNLADESRLYKQPSMDTGVKPPWKRANNRGESISPVTKTTPPLNSSTSQPLVTRADQDNMPKLLGILIYNKQGCDEPSSTDISPELIAMITERVKNERTLISICVSIFLY